MTLTVADFDRVRNGLLAWDLEVRRQTLNDLAASGDLALFEKLLSGEAEGRSDAIGSDFANVFFDVLAAAPEGSPVIEAARARVTSIRFYGSANFPGIVVDLPKWIARLPNIHSLAVFRVHVRGRADHPKLQQIEIGWSDVEDLAELVAGGNITYVLLEAVTVGGAPMTDLEALRGATSLTGVRVKSDTLRDVAALGALPNLQFAILKGCPLLTDVSALVGHLAVRAVLLFESGVVKDTVPAPLRRLCNWARDPDFRKLLHKEPQPPPAPPKKLGASLKASLAKARKLLESTDLNLVQQGISFVSSLGNPALYDELLEGAYYDKDRRKIIVSGWKKPTGTFAFFGVLASAPAEHPIAKRLRDEATDLVVEGPENGADIDRPVDLLHLETFTRLTDLDIAHLGPIVPRDRLPSFPALTELRLLGMRGLTTIDFVAGCPVLKKFTVSGASDLASLSGLSGHPELFIVSLRGLPEMVSLAGIERLPKLRDLHVYTCWKLTDLGTMTDLPALEYVQIIRTTMSDFAPLRGLPALNRLRIEGSEKATSLAALSGHPKLDHLEIVETWIDSLAPLATLPSLQRIYLFKPGPITSVAPLAGHPLLRSIDIDGCPKLRSVDELTTLPLVHLGLARTGVKTVPKALEAVLRK